MRSCLRPSKTKTSAASGAGAEEAGAGLRWLLIQLVLRWRLWRLLRRLLRNLLRSCCASTDAGGSGLRHIRRALVILGLVLANPWGESEGRHTHKGDG